jgi:hypothetical protein
VNPTELRTNYVTFFKESLAGEHFVDFITDAIERNHIKGEEDPANSRDYMQRAKGLREVLDHISSNSVAIKTKSSIERKER